MKKLTLISLLLLISVGVMNLWAQFSANNDAVNPATPIDTPAAVGEPSMPENGKMYYISCATYSGGQYVLRYLYDNNGTLATSTTLSEGTASYQWTCTYDGTNYVFKSGTGNYLAHKKIATSEYKFEVRPQGSGSYTGAYSLFSIADNRYMCLKNDGTAFDQLNTTWNQAEKTHSSDFVFQPTEVITGAKFTVTSNISDAQAKISWNGETKPAPATFVVNGSVSEPTVTATAGNPAYKFVNFTEGTETLESLSISTLAENRTITANYELDVFSQNYGDKWVRLILANGTGYAAHVPAADNYSKAIPYTTPTNLGDESQLWCLVGNMGSFKLYNKACGAEYALTTVGNNYTDGTYTEMTAAADAINWQLIDGFQYTVKGYCISPEGHNVYGLNSYTGVGQSLRFYNNGDQGNQWTIQLAGENGLSLSVELQSESAPANTKLGTVGITYGGATTNINLTTTSTENKLLLPEGTVFSLAKGTQSYRGYEFVGFEQDGKIVSEIKDATIASDGAAIKAVFKATDDKSQYMFYSPSPQGKPYRIPAIAQVKNGNLLAISDYRPCGADIGNGEVDIMCRISKDNGATWSEPFTIADGTAKSGAIDCGFGDAAVVADRESNRVLMICVSGNTFYSYTTRSNPLPVARYYSEDGGETWSKYNAATDNITEQIYGLFDSSSLGQVSGLFFGSGRIMQSRYVKVGEYYRLYAALCARPGGNRVVYSDDFGMTWHALGSINISPAPSGDEPKCEELPDGSVVLSSRKAYGRYFNIFTYTDVTKAEGSWGSAVDSYYQTGGIQTGGNSCNGEILFVPVINNATDAKEMIMLQSIPTGSGRTNVSIFYRTVEKKTYTPTTFAQGWTKGIEVSPRGSGYSTMTIQADGKIGFFYEEEPANYCMVYVPISIEEITGDKYRIDAEATAISTVKADKTAVSGTYDLMGRKVANPSNGIYIIDGKKVVVK